ncbi:MAG: TetR/AcrR family transcriptional regulator [Blastocatellia bacterium]
MGISERRQKEKENLRQEILDAAREIFVAEGYDSFSMRKVAEKIEYSPTTIYLYFHDKSELLREVCEEAFTKLGDAVREAKETGGSAMEVLRKGLYAYIDFGLTNPHHYEVAFVSPTDKVMKPNQYTYEGSAGQRAFEMLSVSVAECMEAGVIRRDDIAKIAQTIWASIHGITSLLIMHHDFPFVERKPLIESVVETTIAGLKP